MKMKNKMMTYLNNNYIYIIIVILIIIIIYHIYISNQRFEGLENKDGQQAKYFLLTCMDYRLLADIILYMKKIGEIDNFDQFILAGASLPISQRNEKWKQTFLENLDLAIMLHKVDTIMIMDHMDCGAYRHTFPEINKQSTKELQNKMERDLHKENILNAVKNLKSMDKYKNMNYTGYIMNLDGSVEKVL